MPKARIRMNQRYDKEKLTRKVCPFPSTTLVTKLLSILLAATVSAQGAEFEITFLKGPSFPAEQEVKIPLFMAWKEPMEIASSWYGYGKELPTETKRMSTPSAIASSKAAKMSATVQLPAQHTYC